MFTPLLTDYVKENILIDGGGAARIGGFGSASLSRLNTPVESTYEWAAPELFSENSRPSKASDIYAFGMIVYEVCCIALSSSSLLMDYS